MHRSDEPGDYYTCETSCQSTQSACRDKSQYLIMQRIADLNYEFPEDFPDEARDLVAQLLVEEPTDRLGYRSIQEIKGHAFFQGAL